MLQLDNESTANTTKAHLDNTHDYDEAQGQKLQLRHLGYTVKRFTHVSTKDRDTLRQVRGHVFGLRAAQKKRHFIIAS